MKETCKVCVIGSGYGGTIPAVKIAEALSKTNKNNKVLVLEKGRRMKARDFKQTHDPRYVYGIYDMVMAKDFSIFFRWGKCLGGGSVVNSGAHLRAPSQVFDYEFAGYKYWPDEVNREVLDPYYDEVEQKLQVNQLTWNHIPRAGWVFAKMLNEYGLTGNRSRFNYVNCLQCGWCQMGCKYDRKKSLLLTYIEPAEQDASLNLEFRTQCEVLTVAEAGSSGYEVIYKDVRGDTRTVQCRILIMGAGAIMTPVILLRSLDRLTGIAPGAKAQIGSNLHNNGDMGFFILTPEEFGVETYKGRDNAGVISYAFFYNKDNPTDFNFSLHPGCLPPLFFAAVNVHPEGMEPVGLAYKRWIRDSYRRIIGALAIGLIPALGRITLDRRKNPVLQFPSPEYKHLVPTFLDYLNYVTGRLREVVEYSGARLLMIEDKHYEYGDAHQMATCRMGADPSRSVVNYQGKVWGSRGLYIADGSTIPSGTGINPALTIGANAARIADEIINQDRAGLILIPEEVCPPCCGATTATGNRSFSAPFACCSCLLSSLPPLPCLIAISYASTLRRTQSPPAMSFSIPASCSGTRQISTHLKPT